MTTASPRFDDSLASVVRDLHLVPVATTALVLGLLAFAWLERRGRTAWGLTVAAEEWAPLAPYRYAPIVTHQRRRAPLLVRGSALGTLLFVNLLAPLALLAMLEFPFDGVAVPLMPGIALLLFNGVAAWLLLARSPHASTAAQSSATASLITSVGMVCIGGVHLWTIEMQRAVGIEHACSTSVTFVVVLFALGSGAQALLTLMALHVHRDLLAARTEEVRRSRP